MATFSYDQYKAMRDNPRILGIVHNGRAGVTHMLGEYEKRYLLEQSLPAIKAAIMGLSPSLTD